MKIVGILTISLLTAGMLCAQETAAQPGKPVSVIGEVTAKTDTSLTVKTDQGASVTVAVSGTTNFLRIAPGEQDIKKATKISQSDMNVGDRVLARTRGADSPATSVIIMTKSDLEQKQAAERAEWQK